MNNSRSSESPQYIHTRWQEKTRSSYVQEKTNINRFGQHLIDSAVMDRSNFVGNQGMSAVKRQGDSSPTIGSPWFTLSTTSISDLASLQSNKPKQTAETKGTRTTSNVSPNDNIPQSNLSTAEQEAREREIALIRKLDDNTRTEIVSRIRKLDGDTRGKIPVQQDSLKESTPPDTTNSETANDGRSHAPISNMTSTETNVRKMIEAFELKLAVSVNGSSRQDDAEPDTTKDESEQQTSAGILPSIEREIPNSSGRESAASSVISKDSTTVSYESASDDSDSRDRYSEPTFWAPGTTESPKYDYGSDRESTSYVTDTETTKISIASEKEQIADDYSEPTFWIETKHGDDKSDFGNKIIPREVVVQDKENESPTQKKPKTRTNTQAQDKSKTGNKAPAKRKGTKSKPINGKKEKKSKAKSKTKTKKKAGSKYKNKGNGKSKKSKKATLKVESFPDAVPVTKPRKTKSAIAKRPKRDSTKSKVSFGRVPISPTEPTSPSTVRSHPFLQWDIESGLVLDSTAESISRSCMDDLVILPSSKVTDGARRNPKVIRRRLIGVGVVLFLVAFSLIIFVLLDPLKRWSNSTR